MCLSDAYELRGDEKTLLLRYVSNLSAEGGHITLTDMMGARKTVEGTLKSVDLTKNVILIEAK